MRTHSLVVSNVTKTFGTLRANDGVTMHVRNASVHAVLGENGAGKSTLMNILYGLYQPDSGQILVRDRPVVIDSPKTALALGIGMVHQHFTLVGPLTVVENVVLGGPSAGIPSTSPARARFSRSASRRLRDRSASADLAAARRMQQRVEILKLSIAMPTSYLRRAHQRPHAEGSRPVPRRARAARISGKTILFVTHKLEEVLAGRRSRSCGRGACRRGETATDPANWPTDGRP